MDRLTQQVEYPLTTFKRCQLCGYSSDDICEFTMYHECDDQDQVEPENILVLCRQETCGKALNDHPRLYKALEWSTGGPGKFMLLCGDCRYREGTTCKHPKLKTNGGDGLEISFSRGILGSVHICFHDENGEPRGYSPRPPATVCEGKESHTVWDRIRKD